MTRDGEMSATDFVTLVLSAVGTETDAFGVSRIPSYAAQAATSYSAPENRAALRATWEQGLRTLLGDAEAGSDHQLSFARAYAAAAHSDEALGDLEALLDGSLSFEGLAIDTDLRWTFVHALAKNGRADGDRIAEELARDNTISGQEHAAAARAARPTAEAKAEAWEIAMVRDDVANETQRSVVLAFQCFGQDDVLTPYVEEYLAAADTVWEDKGTQRASTALEYMFPKQLASQELLDRVDAWLESSPANPAAKRYVREGRADVARALAAQARDAQAR
jgi:aminopeptidase N